MPPHLILDVYENTTSAGTIFVGLLLIIFCLAVLTIAGLAISLVFNLMDRFGNNETSNHTNWYKK